MVSPPNMDGSCCHCAQVPILQMLEYLSNLEPESSKTPNIHKPRVNNELHRLGESPLESRVKAWKVSGFQSGNQAYILRNEHKSVFNRENEGFVSPAFELALREVIIPQRPRKPMCYLWQLSPKSPNHRYSQ